MSLADGAIAELSVAEAPDPTVNPFFTKVLPLDIAFRGTPFVQYGPGLQTPTLDYAFKGQPITLYGDAGVTYSLDVNEAASASDTLGVVLTALPSVTESQSPTDTTSATKATSSSRTEAGTAADTVDAVGGIVSDVSESNTSNVSVDAVLLVDRSITESATSASSQDSVRTLAVDVTEVATAADDSERGLDIVLDVTEATTASEAVTVTVLYVSSVTESGIASDGTDGSGTTKAGKKTKATVTEPATATTTQSAGRKSLVFMSEITTATDHNDATVVSTIKPVALVEAAAAADVEVPNVSTTSGQAENSIAAVVSSASYIGNVIVSAESTPATDSFTVKWQTSATTTESGTALEAADSTTQMDRAVVEVAVASEGIDTAVDWAVDTAEPVYADEAVDILVDYSEQVVENLSAQDSLIEFVNPPDPVFIFEAVAADDIAQAMVIVNAEIEEPTDYLTSATDLYGYYLPADPVSESAAATDESGCTVDRVATMTEFTAALESAGVIALFHADVTESLPADEVCDATRAARLFKSKLVTVEFQETVKRSVALQLIARRTINFCGKVVARRVPFTDPN
jgi:hypothetical protein